MENPGRIMELPPLLVAAMRLRWTTVAAAARLFRRLATGAAVVPRQFFPASDRPELLVDLTLPQNASIFATDARPRSSTPSSPGDPDVASWSTYVGRGAIRFYLPLNVELANDFFAQAVGHRQGRFRARAAARDARKQAGL